MRVFLGTARLGAIVCFASALATAAPLTRAVAQTQASPAVASGLARLVPPVPSPSFIADVPGVLDAGAQAALDTRIRQLQDAGFGDIGVAILPSIGGYAPAEMGVAIYRTWRIGRMDSLGSARRNLGVLLLLVPKELTPDGRGHCWITTGTGAEGVVTDAASGSICRDSVVPHMKNRDYAAAVSAGIEALAARLQDDGTLAAEAFDGSESRRDDGPAWWQVVGGVLGGLFGIGGATAAGLRWRRNRPRRCPKCGQPMQRLDEQADDASLEPGQQVEERIRSVDYDVWRCSCGGELVLPYKKILSGYSECTACHRRTDKVTRTVLASPTRSSSGVAEDAHRCEACGATRTERVTLARLSSSSGSSSGGGGGGGSSFGGSGSTSGGGGGSSY
jgi:uncharacterized protein